MACRLGGGGGGGGKRGAGGRGVGGGGKVVKYKVYQRIVALLPFLM